MHENIQRPGRNLAAARAYIGVGALAADTAEGAAR